MLVEALAAAAGIAIANARLYEQARGSPGSRPPGDIATELLAGAEPARVFRLIADEALRLTGADAVVVAVPPDEDADVDELVVVETAGAAAPSGSISLADNEIGAAFAERTPRRVTALTGTESLMAGAGPALVLPLRTTDTTAGWWWRCAGTDPGSSPRPARDGRRVHRPGDGGLATGRLPAQDARTGRDLRPRAHRPRSARPRHPAACSPRACHCRGRSRGPAR